MADHQASGSAKKTNEGGKAVEFYQLKLKAIGESKLSLLNVLVTDTKQAMRLEKRANKRKYIIHTDGDGMVTIVYEPDDAFAVSLFNRSRWVTNLHVEGEIVKIGNTAQAQASQVSTERVTKNETRNMKTTFKLENCDDALLERLDKKGNSTSWFSVFSHGSDLLMVRPNGDWLAEKMQYLTDQMITKAINNYRRSNGQEVLSSDNTVVMRRRQTSTVVFQSMSMKSEEERAIELIKDEKTTMNGRL